MKTRYENLSLLDKTLRYISKIPMTKWAIIFTTLIQIFAIYFPFLIIYDDTYIENRSINYFNEDTIQFYSISFVIGFLSYLSTRNKEEIQIKNQFISITKASSFLIILTLIVDDIYFDIRYLQGQDTSLFMGWFIIFLIPAAVVTGIELSYFKNLRMKKH